MPEEIKTKKIQVFQLCKDINLPKEDIISFLTDKLGLKNVTLNTKLDEDTVNKVYSHFKKEKEEHEKYQRRVLDFSEKVGVEISEAQELKRRQEEERKKQEEEERIKKALEEKKKREEEERKRQELLALIEREKLLKKEQEEKEAKQKKLIELYEAKKRIQEEKKKKIEEERKKKEQKEIKKPLEKEKPKPIQEAEKRQTKDIEKPKIEIIKPKPEKVDHKQKEKILKDKGKEPKVKEIKFGGDESKVKKGKDKKKITIKDKINKTDQPITPPRTTKERKIKEHHEVEKKKKSKLGKHRENLIQRQEIEEALRETLQRIDEPTPISARAIARKKKKKERQEQEKKLEELKKASENVLRVTEFITTDELSKLMQISPAEIIKECFNLGVIVSINQRLDKTLIELIAEHFGYKVEFQKEYQEDLLKDYDDPPETLKPRPPVVTVMGHVDHGKTSLLDYIRRSNVVAGEAGGITQHIGAYKVKLDEKGGKEITFLDTPGHQAFTAMRARGGQAADIVILVVAADDAVMPQTVEAINHALAANAPIIVAINKIDKPEANPDRIRQQLAERNILVEEWGGKYQSVEISAKFGKNIDLLLEKILLEAELLDLKANPNRKARGVVIESKMDKGRGITATVLVQKGTLRIGDVFVAGMCSGKVKAMFDERERRIDAAAPSTPVQILGFDSMPQAGDTFVCVESETLAREIAKKRQQLKREQDFRTIKFVTLDDISNQIKKGKQVDLKVIIKADADGSVEAIADSLLKLSTPEIKISVVHKAVGQITESDILLAEASNSIIIGFNVRPNQNARKLAEQNKIDIRLHNVIYDVIEEVKKALVGLLEPEKKEEVTAIVEVKEVFKVPKVGNVAGCYVQEGKISRNNKVRIIRDGLVKYEGNILSLKRLKDDVKEVEANYECGIAIENYNDIKVGDIIEAYRIIETKKTLTFEKI
ncbi:MAG: translation initiation factor IF-2 [Ignavibacteria bacterium]|nr:translation initiation factor IF-2 [Ignavibacteria bacterium]